MFRSNYVCFDAYNGLLVAYKMKNLFAPYKNLVDYVDLRL